MSPRPPPGPFAGYRPFWVQYKILVQNRCTKTLTVRTRNKMAKTKVTPSTPQSSRRMFRPPHLPSLQERARLLVETCETLQQNAAAAEQAEVEAGGSSSSTVGAAGCADKRRTRSSDAPEVIEEPPKKKKKGLQKGKVGKGKLSYALSAGKSHKSVEGRRS